MRSPWIRRAAVAAAALALAGCGAKFELPTESAVAMRTLPRPR